MSTHSDKHDDTQKIDDRFLYYKDENYKKYYFTYSEVFKAYEDCIRTKRSTYAAIHFTQNQLISLAELCDDINRGTYDIGKSLAFVVKYPLYREVFAADFRDRIVHHLIINELLPFIDDEFISDSYSCRVGKGVLHGVRRTEEQIRECSENYTKDAWVLKLDLKSFFMSIDKCLLAEIVDKFIVERYPYNRKKQCLRWLCEKVIRHRPEQNCEKRGDLSAWNMLAPGKSLFNVGEDKGLPIGNLTSQIFANFYLNKLDKFITEELGFKYYGRYVDDFVIISDDKKKLKKSVPLIEEFAMRELKLRLHTDKRYLQHVKNGVRFIGGIIKPHRKYVLKRTVGSLYHKMTHGFKEPIFSKLSRLLMVTNSYLGFMGQYSSYNIRKSIFTKWGVYDKWAKWIEINQDYRKISIKKVHKRGNKASRRRRCGRIIKEYLDYKLYDKRNET